MATSIPPLAELDLARCCLVVAHPDDEVLWFSSIVERVGSLVLCYEDCDDYPELGPARRRVLDAYPLSQVSSLRLPEPCSVSLVDWSKPEHDAWGLRLNAPSATMERVERYRRSFQALREGLVERLRGAQAVFTHSPWGEYGHPDHVQVACVVESLRRELGFRLLHCGYIADRTMPLAATTLCQLQSYGELPTPSAMATALQALYSAHGCWTWPEDYTRFELETFLERTETPARPGAGFRLNCVVP